MAAAGSGLHRDFSRGAAAAGIVGAVGTAATCGFGPDPVPDGWVVVVGAGTVVVVTSGTVGDGCGAPGAGFDPAPGPPSAWVVVVVVVVGTGTVVVVVGTGTVVVVGTGTVVVVVGPGIVVVVTAGTVVVVDVDVGDGDGGTAGEVRVTDDPERIRVLRPMATPRGEVAAGRAVALSSTVVAVNPAADTAVAATTTATRRTRLPMRYWCGASYFRASRLCPKLPSDSQRPEHLVRQPLSRRI